jgi:molybdenum cofactor guanylyltransferase
MGGRDKCLREIGGRTILGRVIERARPQVCGLLLNANGDGARFRDYRLPVAADVIAGFAGPLAGILTAMEWARTQWPECRFVASFATDTPFFPHDMVARLRSAIEAASADIACAASGGRTHPVFAVWPVRLAPLLRSAMENEDMRKIDAWTARFRIETVPFDAEGYDPFFNVNAPGDLAEAEARLALSAREISR